MVKFIKFLGVQIPMPSKDFIQLTKSFFGSSSKYFLSRFHSILGRVCCSCESLGNLYLIHGSWKRELYSNGYISMWMYVKRIISNDNMIPIYMGGVVS